MGVRIDRFIWSVRLAKTRTKAKEMILKSRVKINGNIVKPAKEVEIDDRISITKHTSEFSYKVIQLLEKRVGAKRVEEYITDITSIEEIEKLKFFQASQRSFHRHGDGKPSKKDRRALERYLKQNRF